MRRLILFVLLLPAILGGQAGRYKVDPNTLKLNAAAYSGASATADAQIYAALNSPDCPAAGCYVYASLRGSPTWAASPFTGITKPATVELVAGTWAVSTDVTVPANIKLKFSEGAILAPASGKTVTLGPFECGYTQCFGTNGRVVFGTLPEAVDPVWFGATYDNTTDDSAAIQRAINASGEMQIRWVDGAISSGTTTLTSSTANFQPADVGRAVTVVGAGAAGADLTSTISVRTNTTTVTLANAASTTVTDAVFYVGAGTTERGGTRLILSGRAAIGATLVVSGRTTAFEGLGSTFIVSTSPAGSSLRALTSVGDNPMIEVKASLFGVAVRRLRIYGNTTTQPHSAISFVAYSGGAGSAHLVEDVQIGNQSGDTGYQYTNGFPFENGIIVGDNKDGGTDTTSDFITIRRVVIAGCHDLGRHSAEIAGLRVDGAGIRQGGLNPQFLTIENSFVYYADYPYYFASHASMKNVFTCCSSGSDIYTPLYTDWSVLGGGIPANPTITIDGFASEFGRRFMQLEGVASVYVRNGYWQIRANMTSPMSGSGGGNIGLHTDRKVITAEPGYKQSVYIGGDFNWTNVSDTNAWYIAMTPTGVAPFNNKTLILDGARPVGGTAEPTFGASDVYMATVNGYDQRLLWIRKDPNVTTGGGVYEQKNFLTGAIADFAMPDADRYDVMNKRLRIGDVSEKYGSVEISTKSKLFTLTTDCTGAGPVTCTWTNATPSLKPFPAYTIQWGVTARVEAAITSGDGATVWKLGDGTTNDKWGCAAPGCAFAQNTLVYQSTWNAGTAFGGLIGANGEDIVVKSDAGTFSAGTIKVTVFYVRLLVPAY